MTRDPVAIAQEVVAQLSKRNPELPADEELKVLAHAYLQLVKLAGVPFVTQSAGLDYAKQRRGGACAP